MLKNIVYLTCCAFVVGMAYWAYTENYSTQATAKRVKTLQADIAAERQAIAVLNAEWAYLNRPDRLRELADMNFDELQLIPLSSQHFGSSAQISFPQTEADLEFPNAPISVQNSVQNSVQISGDTQ